MGLSLCIFHFGCLSSFTCNDKSGDICSIKILACSAVIGFSRRMTSSPLRKISTSALLKLKFSIISIY